MQTELCTYYYSNALQYAKDGHLNRALELCAAAWGLSDKLKETEQTEQIRKLTGLCYCLLGNYKMADQCFNGLDYYDDYVKKSVKEKIEFINSVKFLINDGQYRKAIKTLETRIHKSVAELNLLGCLYAVKSKRDKAVDCFLQALELNKDGSVAYLENSKQIKKWWFK